ncbi:conserved Plasmodium protein, unknown function [Plasmodium reichenowi]|uniref:Inner membrane complex protein 1l n=1 Tax=Plasmodium reichenowi TaxID=5854 RepID=A0A060RYX3_PLARE|nr:conserved Plasmodium protein, unknown function [Plasmodium reichenowi]
MSIPFHSSCFSKAPKYAIKQVHENIGIPVFHKTPKIVEIPEIREITKFVESVKVVDVPIEQVRIVPKLKVREVEKIRHVPGPIEYIDIPQERIIHKVCKEIREKIHEIPQIEDIEIEVPIYVPTPIGPPKDIHVNIPLPYNIPQFYYTPDNQYSHIIPCDILSHGKQMPDMNFEEKSFNDYSEDKHICMTHNDNIIHSNKRMEYNKNENNICNNNTFDNNMNDKNIYDCNIFDNTTYYNNTNDNNIYDDNTYGNNMYDNITTYYEDQDNNIHSKEKDKYINNNYNNKYINDYYKTTPTKGILKKENISTSPGIKEQYYYSYSKRNGKNAGKVHHYDKDTYDDMSTWDNYAENMNYIYEDDENENEYKNRKKRVTELIVKKKK